MFWSRKSHIVNPKSYLSKDVDNHRKQKSAFEVESTADGLLVDGKPLSWDIAQLADGYFHILLNNKSYKAEIVKVTRDKTFTLKSTITYTP